MTEMGSIPISRSWKRSATLLNMLSRTSRPAIATFILLQGIGQKWSHGGHAQTLWGRQCDERGLCKEDSAAGCGKMQPQAGHELSLQARVSIGKSSVCRSALSKWELGVPMSVLEAVRMMSSEKVLAKSTSPSSPHLAK